MAARYWSGNMSATSTNWNYTTGGTNWGSASGVADDVSVPTSTDDVIFDGVGTNGNSNSTISATITVLSLTITSGYTATMTHSANLTIAASMTLSTSYTIAGTSSLIFSGGGAGITITSNGKVWPNNITFTYGSVNGSRSITGDFTVLGACSFTGRNPTLNAATGTEKLYCNGLSHSNGNSTDLGGSIHIVLTGGSWTRSGTGNPSFTFSAVTFQGDVTLDANDTIDYSGHVYYVSGTITTTNNTFIARGTNTNFDTNGIVWNNLTILNNKTIQSNVNVNGLTTLSTGTYTGAFTLTANSGLTISGNSQGTMKVILTNGTWSGAGVLYNDLDLQGGSIIIGTSVSYRTGTLKYISGTVDTTTNSSTLIFNASATFDTSGVIWFNVTTTNTTGQTYTINSLLSISNILTVGTGAATTFAGTSGFTCGTLSCATTATTTVTFKDTVTYTVTSAFICNQSRIGSIVLFTSSHASNRANLVMPNNGSNLCNVLASFTRIDASGGRSINTFGGTITDCININQYYDYKGIAA